MNSKGFSHLVLIRTLAYHNISWRSPDAFSKPVDHPCRQYPYPRGGQQQCQLVAISELISAKKTDQTKKNNIFHMPHLLPHPDRQSNEISCEIKKLPLLLYK